MTNIEDILFQLGLWCLLTLGEFIELHCNLYAHPSLLCLPKRILKGYDARRKHVSGTHRI